MLWASLLPDLDPSLRFTNCPFPWQPSPCQRPPRDQGGEAPSTRRSHCSRRNRGCTSQAATAGAPTLQGNAVPFEVPLAILWLWCWALAKVGTQSKSKQKSLPWEWVCLAWNALPRFSFVPWDVLWRHHATPNKVWNVRTINHKWQPCHVTMKVFEKFGFDNPSVSDRWDCHGIYFFLLKELDANSTDWWHILCSPALQDGLPVLLRAYEPFNANPVSVLKWAGWPCEKDLVLEQN